MDPFNTTEDALGMSETWISQYDPHIQYRDDAAFAGKSTEDGVSLSTSPATAGTSTSSLLQEFCFENLDLLHNDKKTQPPDAQEEKRSNASRQTTTTKSNTSFGDMRSEARHIGMDGTIMMMRTPSSLGHKTTRKLNRSFSDIRSAARNIGMDGTAMNTPSKSTSHKTTSFSDIRSETRNHNSTDEVMRIASKARVDPEFKLAERRSLSIPRRNLQGKRGRRPTKCVSASDLLRNIEKAPAVLRTRSMEALTVTRHLNKKYSAVLRRTEVRAAIDEVLTAYDDNHKGPSASGSRRSDSKVQHSARTPSFGSTTSRSAGQTNRVSQLTMKVKSSHESFQKVMDESIESDFEVSERNSHQNATFEYIQETPSIEQQLREKDEQIKKLMRQLQDARALNQEKDMEIKRRKSTGNRSRMVSRRSSDPGICVALQQIADLSPTNSSARRSNRKPRKHVSDESESSSVVRRKKKEKASKTTTKNEESSVSCSSRKKGKKVSSRPSSTHKMPRRSTSRLEDGKKPNKESKMKRTKSEEGLVRRGKHI